METDSARQVGAKSEEKAHDDASAPTKPADQGSEVYRTADGNRQGAHAQAVDPSGSSGLQGSSTATPPERTPTVSFQVTAAGQATSSGWRTWLGLVGIVAATVALGHAASSWRHREDPHFVNARKIIRAYELGKDPQTLNYDEPSYQEALAELALVAESSISFPDAQSLFAEISQRIARFRERLKMQQVRMKESRARDQMRDTILTNSIMSTTGTDVDAARRVVIRDKTACQDEIAGYQKGHKH